MTQRRRLQKMRQREIEEKRREEERDRWFNQARPMLGVKKTWKEKMLAREEYDEDNDSSKHDVYAEKGEEARSKDDGDESVPTGTNAMEVNMVFVIPDEFRAPRSKIAELMVGTDRAVF
jgi:hypothetical protein